MYLGTHKVPARFLIYFWYPKLPHFFFFLNGTHSIFTKMPGSMIMQLLSCELLDTSCLFPHWWIHFQSFYTGTTLCWLVIGPGSASKAFVMSQIMLAGPTSFNLNLIDPRKWSLSAMNVRIVAQILHINHPAAKHSSGGNRRKTQLWLKGDLRGGKKYLFYLFLTCPLLQCVVGGCNASFASQGGLARHVPSHFSQQSSSKMSSQAKLKEESPSKAGLNKRKKLKNKRRCSLRTYLSNTHCKPHLKIFLIWISLFFP